MACQDDAEEPNTSRLAFIFKVAWAIPWRSAAIMAMMGTAAVSGGAIASHQRMESLITELLTMNAQMEQRLANMSLRLNEVHNKLNEELEESRSRGESCKSSASSKSTTKSSPKPPSAPPSSSRRRSWDQEEWPPRSSDYGYGYGDDSWGLLSSSRRRESMESYYSAFYGLSRSSDSFEQKRSYADWPTRGIDEEPSASSVKRSRGSSSLDYYDYDSYYGRDRDPFDYDTLDYSRDSGRASSSTKGGSAASQGPDDPLLQRAFQNRSDALETAWTSAAGRILASGNEQRWRIPRILHQTWKSTEVPEKFQAFIVSWRQRHPHWRYEFWDDHRCRELIAERFPKYLHEYDLMSGIKRADVARVVFLHEFGGVYADIDVEAVQPLDSLLEAAETARAGVLLGEENYIHAVLLEQRSTWLVSNAVMASTAGHPFWLEVLREIFRNLWCGDDPVQCTGPRLIDRLSWKHLRENPACGHQGCLVRLPYVYFSPHVAEWNAHNMVKKCSGPPSKKKREEHKKVNKTEQLMACQGLEKSLQYPSVHRTNATFAIHHWQCSWCRKDPALQRTVSLKQIQLLLEGKKPSSG